MAVCIESESSGAEEESYTLTREAVTLGYLRHAPFVFLNVAFCVGLLWYFSHLPDVDATMLVELGAILALFPAGTLLVFSRFNCRSVSLVVEPHGFQVGGPKGPRLRVLWERVSRLRIVRDEHGNTLRILANYGSSYPAYIEGFHRMDEIAATFIAHAPHAVVKYTDERGPSMWRTLGGVYAGPAVVAAVYACCLLLLWMLYRALFS